MGRRIEREQNMKNANTKAANKAANKGATIRASITQAIASLTSPGKRALDKLNALAATSKLARWQLAHGKLGKCKVSHVVTVLRCSEEVAKSEISALACIVNEAIQGGLMKVPSKGGGHSVRAFLSGSLMASLKGTALGAVMASAAWETVMDAAADIADNKLPIGLLLPRDKDKDGNLKPCEGVSTLHPEFRFSFALTRAALKEAGHMTNGMNLDDMAALIEGGVESGEQPKKERKPRKPSKQKEAPAPEAESLPVAA